MKRLHFLITAGPTRERIDPVRYLTNDSSGKMGYALAEAARKMGHAVTLISGPVSLKPPSKIKIIPVESAQEMDQAVMSHFRKADVIIKAAAVADYRPVHRSNQKIKKTKNILSLKLVKNPDILKSLGAKKKKNQILVGFAAETQYTLANAQKKLREKKCDWIVANNVSKKGIGFGAARNEVTLLSKNGRKIKLGRQLKTRLAGQIIRAILS